MVSSWGNLVGLIDSDSQRDVLVPHWSRGSETSRVEIGERVAQRILVLVVQVRLEIVEEFAPSLRGKGG